MAGQNAGAKRESEGAFPANEPHSYAESDEKSSLLPDETIGGFDEATHTHPPSVTTGGGSGQDAAHGDRPGGAYRGE